MDRNKKTIISVVVAIAVIICGIVLAIALRNGKNNHVEDTQAVSSFSDINEKEDVEINDSSEKDTQKQNVDNSDISDVKATESSDIQSSDEEVKIPGIELTEDDADENSCFVVFADYDGRILKKEIVPKGGSAIAPKEPVREGYLFSGWSGQYTNLEENTTIYAMYMKMENESTDAAALIVDNVTVDSQVKSVVVNISINNNPGVLGMILSVEYDNHLKLIDAKNGEALDGVLDLTKGNDLVSGCKFVWDGVEIEDKDIKDGSILSLTFDIVNQTEAGVYPIALTCYEGDVVDKDLKSVLVEIRNGAVTVSK